MRIILTHARSDAGLMSLSAKERESWVDQAEAAWRRTKYVYALYTKSPDDSIEEALEESAFHVRYLVAIGVSIAALSSDQPVSDMRKTVAKTQRRLKKIGKTLNDIKPKALSAAAIGVMSYVAPTLDA